MQKVKCLNCDYEFNLSQVFDDKNGLGTYTVCPKCDGSFDVDVEAKPKMIENNDRFVLSRFGY